MIRAKNKKLRQLAREFNADEYWKVMNKVIRGQDVTSNYPTVYGTSEKTFGDAV